MGSPLRHKSGVRGLGRLQGRRELTMCEQAMRGAGKRPLWLGSAVPGGHSALPGGAGPEGRQHWCTAGVCQMGAVRTK